MSEMADYYYGSMLSEQSEIHHFVQDARRCIEASFDETGEVDVERLHASMLIFTDRLTRHARTMFELTERLQNDTKCC